MCTLKSKEWPRLSFWGGCDLDKLVLHVQLPPPPSASSSVSISSVPATASSSLELSTTTQPSTTATVTSSSSSGLPTLSPPCSSSSVVYCQFFYNLVTSGPCPTTTSPLPAICTTTTTTQPTSTALPNLIFCYREAIKDSNTDYKTQYEWSVDNGVATCHQPPPLEGAAPVSSQENALPNRFPFEDI